PESRSERMCGIVGYVGQRPAAPLLIEGLHRLEYRGYDSAGLAVLVDGRLETRKAAGKIAELEKLLSNGGQPVGTCGIAHTRWATPGPPTTRNPHPHADCHGQTPADARSASSASRASPAACARSRTCRPAGR